MTDHKKKQQTVIPSMVTSDIQSILKKLRKCVVYNTYE